MNCDTPTIPQPVVSDQPTIRSINVDPSIVQFSLDTDGYRDTTLILTLESVIELNGSQLEPSFVVTNLTTGSVDTSGILPLTQGDTFTTNFGLTTTTTQFQNYVVQVFVYDEFGNSNAAEHAIELRGFSNARPQILEVNNPEEVNRPSSGQFLTQFTAKVTDLDGQETIDRVLVSVMDTFGAEVPDSPFQMFDDGATYDDTAANDSVYSITFPISAIQDRSAQTFFIEYFAVDQGGIYSDTTRTIFRITNNQ